MKIKFSSLLFFCCACISAFSQELQSPQINQNAIFANPGLAGSKGQMRICTTLNLVNNNYRLDRTSINNSLVSETYSYNKFYNGLVSADGLVLKNKLGVGAYMKNERYQRTYDNWSYDGSFSSPDKNITGKFNYSNLYFGFILAPKFYIQSANIEKKGKSISPAIGVGFNASQLNYSGSRTYISNHDTIYKDGTRSKSMALDYLSLGLLYSTPKSYIGVKLNFNTYKSSFFLYDISLIIARSYFNKKVANPKFSFNPQFYLAFPAYALRKVPLMNYYDRQNKHNLGSSICINLDFRYKKILFGTFLNETEYNGLYVGITGGVQLSTMKIVINYSPKLSPKTNTTNGLFISANFYIKAKKDTYQ